MNLRERPCHHTWHAQWTKAGHGMLCDVRQWCLIAGCSKRASGFYQVINCSVHLPFVCWPIRGQRLPHQMWIQVRDGPTSPCRILSATIYTINRLNIFHRVSKLFCLESGSHSRYCVHSATLLSACMSHLLARKAECVSIMQQFPSAWTSCFPVFVHIDVTLAPRTEPFQLSPAINANGAEGDLENPHGFWNKLINKKCWNFYTEFWSTASYLSRYHAFVDVVL